LEHSVDTNLLQIATVIFTHKLLTFRQQLCLLRNDCSRSRPTMPYNDRVYRCFHCHHYQQQYPLPLQRLYVVRLFSI